MGESDRVSTVNCESDAGNQPEIRLSDSGTKEIGSERTTEGGRDRKTGTDGRKSRGP